MESEKCGYWHNYKTQKYEYREAPETDEEAKELMPQSLAVQGLYDVHREMGKSILEAMAETLMACVGKKD